MITIARRLSVGISTAFELVRALWRGPFWWLIPVVCLLLTSAVFFIVLQAVPVVAPFVYTLF
ncbi:MAG: hypothetical protein HY292_08595 [Planctomycetes bacterium]|nr:hypothetical protein [Planctomycetota bacterium]